MSIDLAGVSSHLAVNLVLLSPPFLLPVRFCCLSAAPLHAGVGGWVDEERVDCGRMVLAWPYPRGWRVRSASGRREREGASRRPDRRMSGVTQDLPGRLHSVDFRQEPCELRYKLTVLDFHPYSSLANLPSIFPGYRLNTR